MMDELLFLGWPKRFPVSGSLTSGSLVFCNEFISRRHIILYR